MWQIWLNNNSNGYSVWYNFFGLIITAGCLFGIMSRIEFKLNKKIEKLLTYISKISLGIFFIHIIVQRVLIKINNFNFNIINRPISVIILTMLNFIITMGIICILSKIKFIRQRVLLIK